MVPKCPRFCMPKIFQVFARFFSISECIYSIFRTRRHCNQLCDPLTRSTAMGFQAAIGRIASIGGIVTFGSFYNSSPTLPILIVAVCLFTGGICTMALPAVSKADKHNFIVRGTNRICSFFVIKVFRINKPYRSNYTKL